MSSRIVDHRRTGSAPSHEGDSLTSAGVEERGQIGIVHVLYQAIEDCASRSRDTSSVVPDRPAEPSQTLGEVGEAGFIPQQVDGVRQ